MGKNTFFILMAAGLVTHTVRTIYEIMKHRHTIEPGRLSFLIIFTNMAVLWVSWFSMCSIDIYKIYIPSVIRYSGLALAAAGVVMFLVSLFTIRTLETYEGDLITRGIYSRVRHPMYLSFIFWLVGFPVFTGSVNSFAISFLFIANVLFWRHLEELELEKRFPLYREYKQRTFF